MEDHWTNEVVGLLSDLEGVGFLSNGWTSSGKVNVTSGKVLCYIPDFTQNNSGMREEITKGCRKETAVMPSAGKVSSG